MRVISTRVRIKTYLVYEITHEMDNSHDRLTFNPGNRKKIFHHGLKERTEITNEIRNVLNTKNIHVALRTLRILYIFLLRTLTATTFAPNVGGFPVQLKL